MEKEFIPYEQALYLKELGFDEPCFAQYRKYDAGEATLDIGFSKNEIIMQFHKLSKFCSAPTFSQAFRWFREKYNLHCFIQCPEEPIGREIHSYRKWCFSVFEINKKEIFFSKEEFETYEEAELACLKKLVEIVLINK